MSNILPPSEKSFKIKFRGTRGSYPTPKLDFLKYGANTACIQVKIANKLIILDAGTGIIDMGKAIKEKTLKNYKDIIIFLSHLHLYHIQGLQFFSPLFEFGADKNITIYGPTNKNTDLKTTLNTILFDKAFPVGLDEINSNLKINGIAENAIIEIAPDIKISTYKMKSHPKDGSLCIKVEYNSKTLCYATDYEKGNSIDNDFIDFIKNCDCLIHDAQYTESDYNNNIHPKIGYGHSTFDMALTTARLAKAKKLFFFHYDPEYDDKKLEELENKYNNLNSLNDRENFEIHFSKENYEFNL